MFRLRRKPVKQSAALKGQRPKRRSDSANTAEPSPWYTSKYILVIGCATAAVLIWSKRSKIQLVWDHTKTSVANILVLAPSEWSIHMIAPDGNPLGDDVRREILKASAGILKSGSPQELDELSRSIESIGSLEKLHVIRPQYATIVISAGIREPVLFVQAGSKIRYLTAEGTVYGDSANPASNPSGNAPSVLLSGVFEARAGNLQLDRTARLITTADEQAVLINAVTLWRLCSAQNLALRSITYQKFRGFDAKLEDGSEVVLGAAPFEYKIDKLVGIFTKLRKQGVAASRVELDYDGKAFIKERKL